MKYIIMADGSSKRFSCQTGYKKQYLKVDGETLIARTARLLLCFDPRANIIVTTHEKNLDMPGVTLYQPLHNELEIDRFTQELIEPGVCFLYGDTYYSEDAIKAIVNYETKDIMFFGSSKRIFAIIIQDSDTFLKHFTEVRRLYLNQKIKEAIGWEIYHSFIGKPLESREIYDSFLRIEDITQDFNTLEDYTEFINIK